MSYPIDDWFRENLLPKLKKFIESEEPIQFYETKYDEFVDLLKITLQDYSNIKKDVFASALLEIIVGDDSPEIYKKVQKCFQLIDFYSDKELVSLVYKDGIDLITCKYDSIEDQEN